MRCARHPDVETGLRCGKCGQPICPKCLVQTPVGARCPDCAKVKRHVVYQISPTYYARAAAAGLGAGAVTGLIWALIPLGGFLLFFLAGAVGYLLGEVISFSVNRKRGVGLQAIAGLSMILSYFARSFIWSSMHYGTAFSGFLNIYGLIALGIGLIVAVGRLR